MALIVIDLFSMELYTCHDMWARIDEEHNYKEKMFTLQTWSLKSKPHQIKKVQYFSFICVIVLSE
jgi:hypothetical protein